VRDHHVHDHSSRPNIAFLIVFLQQHLGSHVVGSPHAFAQFFIILFLVGNAEVDYLDNLAILLKEHVLGLEVAMHHAHMAEIQQDLQNLLDYACDIILGQFLTRDDFLEQLPSLAELEYQNVVRLVVVDLIEPDDVDMIEGIHDGHLYEQFLVLLLAQRRFLDLFGRAVETSVFGAHFVDLTKPAATDLLDDDIVVEVVALLHLDKTIPFNFNLLALPQLPLRLLHQQILLLVHLFRHLGRDGVLLLVLHVVALLD
jgi:hypothetical protein